MTAAEAADYLRVSEGTFQRYVRTGVVPKHKMGALGTVRFHRDELDAVLDGKEGDTSGDHQGRAG